MSTAVAKALENLKTPSVVIVKDFDTVLAENVALAKEVLGSDWRALESDPYMKKLRVLSLRQMHNNTDKNETIKQLLITTATGTALEHLGLGRGVLRDFGEYPYADFEFTLGSIVDYNVVVPKGTLLNSVDDKYKAETKNDGVILAGDESVTVQVELLDFSSSSEVVTENIVTDLPFVSVVKQLNSFSDGSDAEDDDRYRLRIIQSLARFSTAGSADAYDYHTRSADARIIDVAVLDEQILEVHIYIASADTVDTAMLERVNEACNSKSVRPLSDKVIVAPATVKKLNLTATIQVFDMLKAGEIEDAIRANFHNSFFINQDFIRSDFDRKCHVNGVYKVDSNFTDVLTNEKEIIKIESLVFVFEGVA